MAWELLGSDVLTSSSQSMEVSSFDAKNFLHAEAYAKITGGSAQMRFLFNSSTATHYAIQEEENYGTPATNIEQTNTDNVSGTVGTGGFLQASITIANNASTIKNFFAQGTEKSGTGIPQGKYIVGKYIGTGQVTTLKVFVDPSIAGEYMADSQLLVYGSD